MPNISRFLQAQRFALEGAPPDIRTAAIPPLRPFGQGPATHTNPLEGFRPAHPTSPKGQTLNGKRYRTDRVLPKPDISPATYTPKLLFLTENRFCAKIVFGPKSFLPRGGNKIVFAAG